MYPRRDIDTLYRKFNIDATLWVLPSVKGPSCTCPCHPHSHRLVESFNYTLKIMFQKVVTKKGEDWDDLLPYVLFVYREVPHASTAFLLFEFIYGHNVRGHMPVLKE